MTRVIVEFIPDTGDVVHATAEIEPGPRTKKLNPKAEKVEHTLVIHENLLPDSFNLTVEDGDKVTIRTNAKQRLHYNAAQGTITKVDKEPEKGARSRPGGAEANGCKASAFSVA